jgi:hypothetical protein
MKLPLVLLSCLTVLFYTVSYSSPAIGATPSQVEQSILEVIQNKETRLISVRAKDVSLKNVMQKISQVTGLIVKSSSRGILDEQVQIDLKGLTLKQTIDRLLYGVNSVFFYSSEPATGKKTTPELVKIMLISRKESLPSGTIANHETEQGKTRQARAYLSGKSKLKSILLTRLGRAILGNNPSVTKRIIQQLLETGTEEEVKEAITALGDIVLDPSLYNQASNGHVFYEALEAFKKLDPQGGSAYLDNLLQAGGEPWIQSLAIQGLGEIGQSSSTASLISAFASSDPLIQNAAINSLAKIGDSQGIQQLLQATKSGDPALQQTIVSALAFSGNANSSSALSLAIAENQIPATAVSADITEQLAQSNEPE